MADKSPFKSLFETPQKARITIVCSLVALATLAAILVYIVCAIRNPGSAADTPAAPSEAVSDSPAPSESPSPDPSESPARAPAGFAPSLTIDEARELALADAGIAGDEADISREALTQDNGLWVYEFRFRTDEAQYEYKLNANTGELRGKVKESLVFASPEVTESASAPPAADSPTPASQPPAASPTPAPGPSPVPSQSSSMYVGMDRAKSIALEHAGLTAGQVRFTHTRMDREDGVMVYEIEFRQGQTEYEYEIDAATGRILDWERDTD